MHDEERKRARLWMFVRAMLPIAVGFTVAYLAGAWRFGSVAFVGGAFATSLYAVALVVARRMYRQGAAVEPIALLVGWSLLVMIAIGAFFLHFLLDALVIIPLAGIALVLPYLSPRAVRAYGTGALAVIVEVVVLELLLPPLVSQPPVIVGEVVVAIAVIAAAGLTLQLLLADSTRMHGLLDDARRGRAEAERANAEKDSFLAGAVHDLRTPIGTLLLHVDMMALKGLGESADNARLRRQALRLADLVDRLLDLSKLAEGKLVVERGPVDLVPLLRSTVAEVIESTNSSTPIALELPEVAVVEGDAVRIGQLVTNLLTNALKFGKGQPVTVGVVIAQNVEVRVVDHGLGVRPQDRAVIFERFTRAESAKDYPGLGVGLWIVTEVAKAMRATIAVSDTPGGGATFVVCFPRPE